jgi:hypothetical protein
MLLRRSNEITIHNVAPFNRPQRPGVFLQDVTLSSTDRAQCYLTSVSGQDRRSQRGIAEHNRWISLWVRRLSIFEIAFQFYWRLRYNVLRTIVDTKPLCPAQLAREREYSISKSRLRTFDTVRDCLSLRADRGTKTISKIHKSRTHSDTVGSLTIPQSGEVILLYVCITNF